MHEEWMLVYSIVGGGKCRFPGTEGILFSGWYLPSIADPDPLDLDPDPAFQFDTEADP